MKKKDKPYYHYLHMKINQKDLPENWTTLYGAKYEIIGFSFDHGIVEVELCRLVTERIPDSLIARLLRFLR